MGENCEFPNAIQKRSFKNDVVIYYI